MIFYTVKVCRDGTKEWYRHGKLHREDGAAIEGWDGGKEWYLNGKRHREDGAAVERSSGTKRWYINGKLHREDGAAVEYASGVKEWYLNDERYTEEEHRQATSPCKEYTVEELEQLLGHSIKIVK